MTKAALGKGKQGYFQAELLVVGSGDAFNAGGCGHSCYVVRDGAGAYMVDCGGTALQGLKRWNFDAELLDGICFTHLHGDHIGGFPYLLLELIFYKERMRPLWIMGPPPVERRLRDLCHLHYPGLFEKRLSFPLRFYETKPGSKRKMDGRVFRRFAAYHQELPEMATCLRVEAEGAVVAFSGDTGLCQGLFQAAQGADLLVSECSFLHPIDGLQTHLSYDEIVANLQRLGARRVLLSHQGQDVREQGGALALRRGKQSILMAEDGQRLRIGRRS